MQAYLTRYVLELLTLLLDEECLGFSDTVLERFQFLEEGSYEATLLVKCLEAVQEFG